MTYYMCFIQTLIMRCTVYEIQTVESYGTFILHLKVIQGQRSKRKLKSLYMTLYMCSIETLVIACIGFQIFVQIDL